MKAVFQGIIRGRREQTLKEQNERLEEREGVKMNTPSTSEREMVYNNERVGTMEGKGKGRRRKAKMRGECGVVEL